MTGGRRRIRRLVWAGVAVVAGVLAFKLVEPGFVWAYGWQPLPRPPYPTVTVQSDGWSDIGTRAQAWLNEARARLAAPALSAAVSVDRTRVWAGAAGYADVEQALGATPDTVFRLGSTSKAVTSMAMGTLIDRNAVNLDAPVSTYLPDLSPVS